MKALKTVILLVVLLSVGFSGTAGFLVAFAGPGNRKASWCGIQEGDRVKLVVAETGHAAVVVIRVGQAEYRVVDIDKQDRFLTLGKLEDDRIRYERSFPFTSIISVSH